MRLAGRRVARLSGIASLACAGLISFAFASSSTPVHAKIVSANRRKPASALSLPDANGKSVRLSDFRGKVVLLDFWATACDGCRLQIPWFMEFVRASNDRGLAALGVSLDVVYENLANAGAAWTRVGAFVSAHRVNYQIVMGDDSAGALYDITTIPTTLLIDRHGRIAARYEGIVDRNNLESNLNILLTEP